MEVFHFVVRAYKNVKFITIGIHCYTRNSKFAIEEQKPDFISKYF